MTAGEERSLKARLRQMEGRRSAVETCGMVRAALASSDTGLVEALRSVRSQLAGVLMQEESLAGKGLRG